MTRHEAVRADVAVIGAGPAGAWAAHWLARGGARVVLLDAGPSRRKSLEWLPAAVQAELATGGAGHVLAAADGEPGETVLRCWRDRQWRAHAIARSGMGQPWCVARSALDAELVAVAEASGASLVRPFRVLAATRDRGGWRLLGQGPRGLQEVVAGLVLDGSGGGPRNWHRAVVASRVEGTPVSFRLRLLDVGAVDGAALALSAEPWGWWYAIASTDGTCLIGAASDPPGPPPAWDPAEALATIGWHAVPRPRAGSWAATHVVTPGWIEQGQARNWHFAGDAAVVQDPILGQGVLCALVSGREAAMAVLRGESDRLAEMRIDMGVASFGDALEAYRAAEMDTEFWSARTGRTATAALP